MTPRQLFEETDAHLLADARPSAYLNGLPDEILDSEFPFSMLGRLKRTMQPPRHHPEGSVWNHTMLVVDEAARVRERSADPRAFLWAALLHDIGKPETTRVRGDRITSYDHDKLGAERAEQFLSAFGGDREWIRRVCSLVRYHMQLLFVVRAMPFADIPAMKRETDVREVALLGFCDRAGRLGADREAEKETARLFLLRCGESRRPELFP